jgi:hypothetical protein
MVKKETPAEFAARENEAANARAKKRISEQEKRIREERESRRDI